MAEDVVNHPSHYTSHPSGIECFDITKHLGLPIGTATKYAWRTGLKDTLKAKEDLEKAKWYVENCPEDEIPTEFSNETRQLIVDAAIFDINNDNNPRAMFLLAIIGSDSRSRMVGVLNGWIRGMDQ